MLLNKWASIDDRSPFGDFWFEPVSRHSITGQRVGAEQAMRLAAVYACVALLSKCFAVMPFELWRPEGAGRKRITTHWINRLLGQRPNKFQNPFEFRQMLEGHLALRGNAFCEIQESRGAITDLIPKHPDRMKAELLPNADYRYVYFEPDGTETSGTFGDFLTTASWASRRSRCSATRSA
jgi:HK97 family phage portal protein